MLSPDYAKFDLKDGKVIPGDRMRKKLEAVPIPEDLTGKTVLDVGCDYGQFSFLCANRGAEVLGLDRNRTVKGVGFRNLVEINKAQNITGCDFKEINLGEQWHEFGKFDIILMMSMYHHVYEQCKDHKPIWFWLWRHCRGYVLWENPLDDTDKVVGMNVSDKSDYNKESILEAAHIYFDSEYIGHAKHEPNRHVYKFIPKKGLKSEYSMAIQNGTGGATRAFEFENGRRIAEIEHIVGYKPFPGSMNGILNRPFNWKYHYYPAKIMDVKDRGLGLRSLWQSKSARFYPVDIGHVFRFEGEKYPSNFVEIVAPNRLRDGLITEISTCA